MTNETATDLLRDVKLATRKSPCPSDGITGTGIHSAAGSLVAAEAGATVTDVFGSRWHPNCDSILASADPAFAAAVLGVSRAMSR